MSNVVDNKNQIDTNPKIQNLSDLNNNDLALLGKSLWLLASLDPEQEIFNLTSKTSVADYLLGAK